MTLFFIQRYNKIKILQFEEGETALFLLYSKNKKVSDEK
ncbi:MAG: hypothetical protein K0R50_1253 [Eubacterium sp.]|jgi:hypothetical protein|nr:hypothetical protein [Eubacterium sp.]